MRFVDLDRSVSPFAADLVRPISFSEIWSADSMTMLRNGASEANPFLRPRTCSKISMTVPRPHPSIFSPSSLREITIGGSRVSMSKTGFGTKLCIVVIDIYDSEVLFLK